jgi:hypothetical protein
MLPIRPVKLVIAQHPVDFRKQWDGLLGEAYKLGFDPYEGDCVVFLKRDKTQLRALLGDHRGLFLMARRFEGGRLGIDWVLSPNSQPRSISMAELALLLEGASFTVHRRVKPWR